MPHAIAHYRNRYPGIAGHERYVSPDPESYDVQPARCRVCETLIGNGEELCSSCGCGDCGQHHPDLVQTSECNDGTPWMSCPACRAKAVAS